MLFKERLQHKKKFTATAARLVFSKSINLLQYQMFIRQLHYISFLFFMISLRRITQQPANLLYTYVLICLFYFEDCWVPGFFLILMFSCFSATLINVSSTSALSSWCFSCFSSLAIFWSNAASLSEIPASL